MKGAKRGLLKRSVGRSGKSYLERLEINCPSQHIRGYGPGGRGGKTTAKARLPRLLRRGKDKKKRLTRGRLSPTYEKGLFKGKKP